MSLDVNTLSERFEIPGHVVVKEGPAGLVLLDVTNTLGSSTIALQGAHIMTWAPRGEAPVIWLSPFGKFATGKSIRGGVPICWPWFGPHESDAKLPGHGYARTTMWEVVRTEAVGDSTRLVFRLIENSVTKAQWPHDTEVTLTVTVGQTLSIQLTTTNRSAQAVTLGDALHTYFEVKDVRDIKILGLENCPYIDKVDGQKRKQQQGPVTIDQEVDRIYLESTQDCILDDPGLQRKIRIAKRGSRSTVVWNPWIEKAAKMGDFGENGYLGMVCIESANAADDVISLAPGASHTLDVTYSVER